MGRKFSAHPSFPGLCLGSAVAKLQGCSCRYWHMRVQRVQTGLFTLDNRRFSSLHPAKNCKNSSLHPLCRWTIVIHESKAPATLYFRRPVASVLVSHRKDWYGYNEGVSAQWMQQAWPKRDRRQSEHQTVHRRAEAARYSR